MNKPILLISKSDNQIDELFAFHKDEIIELLNNVRILLYVPYATDEDWDINTQRIRDFFNSLGIAVLGIHQVPQNWIFSDFEAVCIGDGSIERLLKEMETRNFLEPFRSAINSGKVRCIGVGAGAQFLQ